MSTHHFTSYSLRDLFRMGFSAKRHRLGRTSKKPKRDSYQPRYAHRTTYSDQDVYHYPEYSKPSYSSSRKHHLTSLPPEIQLEIFDTLDPVSSTCLGLTSKQFYPIHRSTHQHVPLYQQTTSHGMSLCCLLKDWAPNDMILDARSGKLVSSERYRDLGRDRIRREKEKDRRVGWEREYREGGSREDKRRYGVGHCLHPAYESFYEVGAPRLRRKRRLERRDLWYGGRRY
ncbi:hypothetical protein BJ878DRAFT_119842 [Calycina marina]|uniref:F-box domain-containing protein n=1 Tax=Calycina marina TaxID=1763456 RepID=A0A9P7Z0X2_9HELO|nr:hypothetical protein BJ878DRAFT_119842 [Calycina marina]